MGYSNYHVQGLQILLYPPRKRRSHVSREKFSLQVLGILYRITRVSSSHSLSKLAAILAAGAIWCEPINTKHKHEYIGYFEYARNFQKTQ
jgi:hypothetical protein